MKKFAVLLAMAGALVAGGCTSVGSLGMVTKSSADPAALLRNPRSFKDLGSVHGSACRTFLLGAIPFGNSAFSTAVDDALSKVDGDALLNVTVSSSLYGFIPIYNVLSYTCTDVQGVAIRFDKP